MTPAPLRLRFALLAVWIGVATAAAEPTTTNTAAPAPLSAEAFTTHVKFLASDALAGRCVGSAGIERAGEYIAQQFEVAGLQPAREDGDWFQKLEATWGRKLVDEHALLALADGSETWAVRKDWIPLPFSTAADVEGPLAFAGYGIEAPEYGYDDYADFDAKDKLLLVFRYEPVGDDPGAAFGGKTPSRYALFSRKAKAAATHGARGLLIVNPTQRVEGGDPLYPFDVEQTHQMFGLPLVQITRALADAWLKKAGQPDLATLEDKLNRERKPLSADLNLTLHLKTGIEPNVVPARNVLGRLAGRGGTPETIIVGAHYDHIGRSARYSPTGEMMLVAHNGADDNASGTAGVIELARVMTADGDLRRNILFIAFTGEEAGLVGSNYFVAHPTIELGSVRAMVNLDMIGRLHQRQLVIVGTRTATEFADLAGRAAAGPGLEFAAPPTVAADSDHGAFIAQKIPVLFVTTGVHPQYHQPSDDWELLDAQGAARVLAMSQRLVHELACMTEGPTYQEPPKPEKPDEAATQPGDAATQPGVETPEGPAEPHAADAAPAAADEAPRVRLEIVVDEEAGGQPGVRVLMVVEGGAAQRAGLRDGDRLVRIDNVAIGDVRDYLAAMGTHKPGDEVSVTAVREGKEVALKVALAAGPRRRTTPD